MCGIAGIIRANDKFQIKPKNITKTLLSLQSRGTDATGIAWLDEGKKFLVLKAPCKAEDFVTLPEYIENLPRIVKSKQILMHARWATQGSPMNNVNNHPIWNSEGLIIHNGVISVSKNLPADGYTDTEQIMLYIQKFGWKAGLKEVRGSLSIAYASFSDGDIYFYSESNPFVYARNDNVFIFASTETIASDGFGIDRKCFKDLKKQTVFRLVKNRWLMPVTQIKRSFSYGNPLWKQYYADMYGDCGYGSVYDYGASKPVETVRSEQPVNSGVVSGNKPTEQGIIDDDASDWESLGTNVENSKEVESKSNGDLNPVNEG